MPNLRGPAGGTERIAARRQRALELRIAGARYRQIGKELGVNHQTAYTDVQAALEEVVVMQRKQAERLRDIELERCERMTLALWPKVRTGDENAIRAMVRVMERRAKLLGLDAPAKQEWVGEDAPPARVEFVVVDPVSPKDTS